jgi:3-(3-hydroxy-phenyl)propionate hydroxylase
VAAAQENLAFTESSTSFIAPAGPGELALRDAVLELARRFPFARALINSGRLSTPTLYCDSPLSTPDVDLLSGRCPPGAPAQDAPVTRSGEPGYLLGQLGGGFDLLIAAEEPQEIDAGLLGELAQLPIPIRPIVISARPWEELPAAVLVLHDVAGLVRERFDLQPGSCYLLRPDQHVAARWRKLDQGAIMAALDRATGRFV